MLREFDERRKREAMERRKESHMYHALNHMKTRFTDNIKRYDAEAKAD
jgi:hypothetical protein